MPVPGAVYIGGPLSLDAMFDRLTNESGAMFFSGANLSVCDLLVKRGPLKEFSIIMNNVHYTWKITCSGSPLPPVLRGFLQREEKIC